MFKNIQNGNQETKVFRTCAKNLKLLEIDKKKSISIVNGPQRNNKDSNIKCIGNKVIERKDTCDIEPDAEVKMKNVEQKVIRVFKAIKPFAELLNKTKQKGIHSKANKTKTNEDNIKHNLMNDVMVNINEINDKELLNKENLDFDDNKINCDRNSISDNNYNSNENNCDSKVNNRVNKLGDNVKETSVLETVSVNRCGKKSQGAINPQSEGTGRDDIIDDTNDSGIDIDGDQAYSLGKSFLSEVATTFHAIYQFL